MTLCQGISNVQQPPRNFTCPFPGHEYDLVRPSASLYNGRRSWQREFWRNVGYIFDADTSGVDGLHARDDMTTAVLYEKDHEMVIMTLNRPEALNSINRQLRHELNEAIVRFDRDDQARVAIITGAGRAFCAGRDLKERAADNAAGVQARASDSMGADSLAWFEQTWKPMIAAINGYAMAGGWAIAQICDLRIAAEDAMMGITETRWSLLPPFATALPKLVPMAAALELVMTAKPITAQRAYEIGFVNHVVPKARLLEEAKALARQIIENAPLSVRYFKELAYRGLDMSEPALGALTRHLYDQLLRTEDSKEGPRAFAEKRKPQWKGR
jgi:enoyl-CoA hydratase